MAGTWRKAMHYLGLGPDDEYDDYEPVAAAPVRQPARAVPAPAAVREPDPDAVGTVRPISRSREREATREVPVREVESPSVSVRPRTASVRTVPSAVSAKPHTVEPHSFNEAQEVADRFKEGQPVIVNLQSVDRDLGRRLIDFASGLCYGLGGSMKKVANGVYLLTPVGVDTAPDERRRSGEPADDDLR